MRSCKAGRTDASVGTVLPQLPPLPSAHCSALPSPSFVLPCPVLPCGLTPSRCRQTRDEFESTRSEVESLKNKMMQDVRQAVRHRLRPGDTRGWPVPGCPLNSRHGNWWRGKLVENKKNNVRSCIYGLPTLCWRCCGEGEGVTSNNLIDIGFCESLKKGIEVRKLTKMNLFEYFRVLLNIVIGVRQSSRWASFTSPFT